jgi:hypothetical protein
MNRIDWKVWLPWLVFAGVGALVTQGVKASFKGVKHSDAIMVGGLAALFALSVGKLFLEGKKGYETIIGGDENGTLRLDTGSED